VESRKSDARDEFMKTPASGSVMLGTGFPQGRKRRD
jgi:hypothetical protein